MKWLCKKVYTLEGHTDDEGNTTYTRGEFSHIEPVRRTSGGIPRGSYEAYEYILLEGVSTKFPRVSNVGTIEEPRYVIEEESSNKIEDDLIEKYLKRIEKAPRIKAIFAAAMSKLPDNDAMANTSALSSIQLLVENGSWGTLSSLIPTLTGIPEDIRNAMSAMIQEHLDNE